VKEIPGRPSIKQKKTRSKTPVKDFKVDKHLAKSKDPQKKREYERAKQEFVTSNINKISTNFCCFGQRCDTLTAYSKLLGLVFGKLTPLRLRVDCYLFHGCDPLTATKSATTSREVYFNNTVTFNQNISFEKLKYC